MSDKAAQSAANETIPGSTMPGVNISAQPLIGPGGDRPIITGRGNSQEEASTNLTAAINAALEALTPFGYRAVAIAEAEAEAAAVESREQRLAETEGRAAARDARDAEERETPARPAGRSRERGSSQRQTSRRERAPRPTQGTEDGEFEVATVEVKETKKGTMMVIVRGFEKDESASLGFHEGKQKAKFFPSLPIFAADEFDIEGIMYDADDAGMPALECEWVMNGEYKNISAVTIIE